MRAGQTNPSGWHPVGFADFIWHIITLTDSTVGCWSRGMILALGHFSSKKKSHTCLREVPGSIPGQPLLSPVITSPGLNTGIKIFDGFLPYLGTYVSLFFLPRSSPIFMQVLYLYIGVL